VKSFYYIVKNRKGEVLKGLIRTGSEADAERHFRKHGYIVLSIEEGTKGGRRHRGTVGISVSNIAKALAIVIIIGAIYAYVEIMRHCPSYEGPIFRKFDGLSQVKPLDQEPVQDALIDMPGIVGEAGLEDNVVRIKMRGSGGSETARTSSDSYGDSYHKAVSFYNQGMLSHSKRPLREAIKYAQYALSSAKSEGVREQMRQIIRESRKLLWSGKAY